jgi:FkbM family methyltransferase
MSANAEDVTIFDAFFNSSEFRGGNHTYMEIGAHDGVRESNSRFYDLCLGWNGLLVEPHPKNYERTVQLRPNAHHLGLAPSCNANETGIILFPEHMYTSAAVNETGSKIEIHCGPLQYYLDALGIHHIDFWSLDVEGSELKVLQTINFHRTNIDVIIVESANRMSHLPEIQQKVEDVRALLLREGYLMIASVKVHKSDVFLHKRACNVHSNIEECKGQ